MSTLAAWINEPGMPEEPPHDVSREEFDLIRRRQEELIRRVQFVEAQVRALEAKVDDDA